MRWVFPGAGVGDGAEEHAVRRLATELGLEPLAARVLVSRGLGDPATAAAFLADGLSELPDPFLMKGMDVAVERLTRAIVGGEKITLYGDYDVDGVVLDRAALALPARRWGPRRDLHPPPARGGLRPQHRAVERIATDGTRLLVTLDCGITTRGRGGPGADRWAWTWWWSTTTPCPRRCPPATAVLNPLPARLRLPHQAPLRRRGGLQPRHGAAQGAARAGPLRRERARAGAQAVPRSGGPGHRGRRGAARRVQPGAGEARAGGAGARQRPGRAGAQGGGGDGARRPRSPPGRWASGSGRASTPPAASTTPRAGLQLLLARRFGRGAGRWPPSWTRPTPSARQIEREMLEAGAAQAEERPGGAAGLVLCARRLAPRRGGHRRLAGGGALPPPGGGRRGAGRGGEGERRAASRASTSSTRCRPAPSTSAASAGTSTPRASPSTPERLPDFRRAFEQVAAERLPRRTSCPAAGWTRWWTPRSSTSGRWTRSRCWPPSAPATPSRPSSPARWRASPRIVEHAAAAAHHLKLILPAAPRLDAIGFGMAHPAPASWRARWSRLPGLGFDTWNGDASGCRSSSGMRASETAVLPRTGSCARPRCACCDTARRLPR